jgi:hypothetical protein
LNSFVVSNGDSPPFFSLKSFRVFKTKSSKFSCCF